MTESEAFTVLRKLRLVDTLDRLDERSMALGLCDRLCCREGRWREGSSLAPEVVAGAITEVCGALMCLVGDLDASLPWALLRSIAARDCEDLRGAVIGFFVVSVGAGFISLRRAVLDKGFVTGFVSFAERSMASGGVSTLVALKFVGGGSFFNERVALSFGLDVDMGLSWVVMPLE